MKNSIPVDLIYEILSRLPGKLIARFRCVSKLWCSILRRQDFIDLFLTRSSARPRLLITLCQESEWSFYTTPLPRNPYEKWSNVAAADFHMNFSKDRSRYSCGYASGLIYFHKLCVSRVDEDVKCVICNPLTGQYVILPELRVRDYSASYLGFDSINYEFKVLLTHKGFIGTDCHILTLGTGELRWRKILCPFTHQPLWKTICINGVLYYLAHSGERRINVIVCFDVRSEKFKFVEAECRYDQLINYKGKLCGIKLEYEWGGGFLIKLLSMWVLEDVKKQEWSKYVYSLPHESEVVKVGRNFSVSGMTATGDIVLTMVHYQASKPFYVCYLNPERKTLRIVELQGLRANRDDGRLVHVDAFVDYIEDLSVNDAMQLKSSPSQQQGRNILTKRPKPQQRRQHTSRRKTGTSSRTGTNC